MHVHTLAMNQSNPANSLCEAMGGGKERVVVYVCIRSHLPPMAQEGEEMVRGPRFELGTPRFSV